MSVEGIELEVGQVWKTRCNEVVTISETTGSQVYPWLIKHQAFSYSVDACGFVVNTPPGYQHVYDLVALLDAAAPVTITPQPVTVCARVAEEARDPLRWSDNVGQQGARNAEARRLLDACAAAVVPVQPSGSVGDINSDAKGSGARYNAGKPPYELVPLQLMARYYRAYLAANRDLITDEKQNAVVALEHLASFQERYDGAVLIEALLVLGQPWPSCAKVFGYGKRKYIEWNWAKGMAWSIPIACAARHLEAIILGQDMDPESGELHAGHVACNIVMLLTFERTFPEGDDRAAAGLLAPVAA